MSHSFAKLGEPLLGVKDAVKELAPWPGLGKDLKGARVRVTTPHAAKGAEQAAANLNEMRPSKQDMKEKWLFLERITASLKVLHKEPRRRSATPQP